MEDILCNEKHKHIDSRLGVHDKRLDNHGDRLDIIEQGQVEFRIQIKKLCEDIRDLTGMIKWLVGILITTLIGFFFAALKSILF